MRFQLFKILRVRLERNDFSVGTAAVVQELVDRVAVVRAQVHIDLVIPEVQYFERLVLVGGDGVKPLQLSRIIKSEDGFTDTS